MKHLSIVLAIFNEEKNLDRCLSSVKDIADEIIIVDGGSTDASLTIAQQYNARIIETDNPLNFHINKQKAVEAAAGEWILQLDADEEVSPELAQEIQKISYGEKTDEYSSDEKKKILFERHQRLIEERDHIKRLNEGSINAYYLPRRNFFLGKPMTYAGMYPDGVIRLFRRGKATVRTQSVHDATVVEGRISWTKNDLYHYSNPTLKRYMQGANTYTSLLAKTIRAEKRSLLVKFILYCVIKPKQTFFSLFIQHKGILDGFHGFLFSLFSALHFPVAFWKSVNNIKTA